MTERSNPTHGLEPVQRMADQRILLDFIGKRTAIDVVTAGSSYNNVNKVLYSYILFSLSDFHFLVLFS